MVDTIRHFGPMLGCIISSKDVDEEAYAGKLEVNRKEGGGLGYIDL